MLKILILMLLINDFPKDYRPYNNPSIYSVGLNNRTVTVCDVLKEIEKNNFIIQKITVIQMDRCINTPTLIIWHCGKVEYYHYGPYISNKQIERMRHEYHYHFPAYYKRD